MQSITRITVRMLLALVLGAILLSTTQLARPENSLAISNLFIATQIIIPGATPARISITPSFDGSKVWVSKGDTIYVIDTSTNSIVDSKTLVLPFSDMAIEDIGVHPDGSALYIVSRRQTAPALVSRVSVLDPSTLNVITNIDDTTRVLHWIGIPKGDPSHLIVGGFRGWLRIRASDNQVVNSPSFAVDTISAFGTVSHDGTKVYGQRGHTVSGDTAFAFDAITGTQLGSFTFGDAGGGMHYTTTSAGDRVILFVGDSSISQNAYILNPENLALIQTLNRIALNFATESVDGDSVIITENRNDSGGGANSGVSLVRLNKDGGSNWTFDAQRLELVSNPINFGTGKLVTIPQLGRYYVPDANTSKVFVIGGEQAVIPLLSGTDGLGNPGTVCGFDPLTNYTSNSVSSPTPALIGRGFRIDPCEDVNNRAGGPESQTITNTNGNDTSATFVTTFELPQGYSNPTLNMEVSVDDIGRIFLNGNQITEVCLKDAIVHNISTSNPAFFVEGTNVVSFDVVNNAANCTFTSLSRGGDFDAMNVEFDGTVIFDPPPVASGAVNINDDIELIDLDTSYDPTPVEGYAGGVFSITATWMANSSLPMGFFEVFAKVAVLEGAGCDCAVLNADGGPGSVGAQVSLTDSLAPGEAVTKSFQIGLSNRAPFEFFVNVYGVPD